MLASTRVKYITYQPILLVYHRLQPLKKAKTSALKGHLLGVSLKGRPVSIFFFNSHVSRILIYPFLSSFVLFLKFDNGILFPITDLLAS